MEDKLQSYRLRKRRQERFELFKNKIISMIPLYGTNNNIKSDQVTVDLNQEAAKTKTKEEEAREQPNNSPVCSELASDYVSEDDDIIFPKRPKEINPLVPTSKYLRYFYWIVLILFWITCYAIAIELRFGIVYLMFSALFAIYFNTRTGPKLEDEVSAYSVFNKNCESIDGTLKAEQFEQEIRYGPLNVR